MSADAQRGALRKRVLSAGKWTVAGFAASQAIRFGSNLLFTRLLVPEMFGIMAIAMMLVAGIGMFSDVGLKQNVVQSKSGDDARFLNTAWVTQIVRGLVICLVGLVASVCVMLANHAGAFPGGSVYTEPALPHVIAALSVSNSSKRSCSARQRRPPVSDSPDSASHRVPPSMPLRGLAGCHTSSGSNCHSRRTSTSPC